MSAPKLLGEIVQKDGMICLQTGPSVWFPLRGNSEIAVRFQETFNRPLPSDIGRRLYDNGGVIQMESTGQAAARIAREKSE